MSGRLRGKSVIAILCAGIMLCACSENTPNDGVSADGKAESENFEITRQDQETDLAGAKEIDLGTCKEQLMITEGGEYLLDGSMEGQVIIDTYEDELVHLYLAGVDISSPQGPAISAVSASKLIVTLVSDTENVLSDTPNYAGYESTEGCLYSVTDLTINGDGALTVYSYHEDGIRSKDCIKIMDGTIAVQAKGDGIRGNDGIVIKEGDIQVQSEGTGLRTVNHGTNPRGVVEITGGTVSITAGKSGISAASDLYIRDCSCSVYSVEETLRAEGTKYIDEGCVE